MRNRWLGDLVELAYAGGYAAGLEAPREPVSFPVVELTPYRVSCGVIPGTFACVYDGMPHAVCRPSFPVEMDS